MPLLPRAPGFAQGGLHRATKYRPDIDGLRALAVISVVAYHCAPRWAKGGYIGVDVFFVISGYLIGSMVYKEIRSRSFSIAEFYKRRAKRILPALFGILIFCYVVGVLMLSPQELQRFSGEAFAAITSGSNIYYLRSIDYFHPDARLRPLLMTWSLGVEEQFYIVFPLLMLLLRRQHWRTQFYGISIAALLSLVAWVWGTHQHPGFTFYMLPTRAWELAAGVLLAVYEADQTREKNLLTAPATHAMSVLGFGLIVLANAEILPAADGRLLAVAAALLVIASPNGIANRLLSWRPIVFIGLVSYSWYLWHWPMLSFARIASGSEISARAAVVIGVASFGCAVLSYFLVERPFRASTTPTSRLLLRYAALAAVMAVAPAAFYLGHGLPQRNRDIQRIDAAGDQLRSDDCLLDWEHTDLSLKAPCVPTGRGRAVALFGDSHAAMLAGALRPIAEHNSYSLVELAMAGCPPMIGVSSASASLGPPFARICLRFQDDVVRYLEQDHSIQVVVLAGHWDGPFHDADGAGYVDRSAIGKPLVGEQGWALARAGLNRLVSELEASGKMVYLLQDAPSYPFDPHDILLTRDIWLRYKVARWMESPISRYPQDVAPELDSQQAVTLVSTVAAAHPKTRVFDLHNALCTSSGCRFVDENQTLYIDTDHLSPLGAEIALTGFRLP